MNLLLVRTGYPPLVIAPEHRARYIDALQALQLAEEPAPYMALMAERLEASLDHHLTVLSTGDVTLA